RQAASGAEGVHRGAGRAMRLLHQRHGDGIGRIPGQDQESERGRHQEGARQQSLPLRHACAHRRSGQARGAGVREAAMNIHSNIRASRRNVLKGGGALIVSFSFAGHSGALAQGGAPAQPGALTEVDSFLAIDAKGAVTAYSGKVDLGTGVRTALTQIVAEELDVPMSRVTLVTGDTDLTPDQGTTWGSLSIQVGGVQMRNAAATARAALLEH